MWHNLRSSCQTELTETFPSHVVTAWLGNSERIAEKHYLQVLDSHFAKAVLPSPKTTRNPTRAEPETTRSTAHGAPMNTKTPYLQGVRGLGMGDTGFEPVTSTV